MWLEAIKRPEFRPMPFDGLCKNHFFPQDILKESVRGACKLKRLRLKHNSLPILFNESNLEQINLELNENFSSEDETNTEVDNSHFVISKSESNIDVQQSDKFICFDTICDVYEETVDFNESFDANEKSANDNSNLKNNSINSISVSINNIKSSITMSTQTSDQARYNIEDFKFKPKLVLLFTGLENYEKFMTVFYSLGPAVEYIKYQRSHIGNISILNQLFLVLWKLRRGATDLELSEHFNIPHVAVGNIFISWIKFMSKVWSLIDIWPSRELIDYYMPDTFKKNFPKTRAIIDATEIKIDGPSKPLQKQAAFSTYKNAYTFKTVIACSPGGMITWNSDMYAGSTSDRQVMERSELRHKCEPGDELMGDKGFTIQDIYASSDVKVTIPTVLKNKNHFPHKIILKDRLLSKHRVHIERIIGLIKTYKLLAMKLNHNYAPLATEILQVCVMLCNFKDNIMSK